MAAFPNYTLGILQQDRQEVAKKSSIISKSVADLKPIDQQYGMDLQFTKEQLASQKKSKLAYANLAQAWKNTVSASGNKAKSADDFLTLLSKVIAHAGDTSNLILDPDLDSYYLMDVTLLGIPQAIQHLTELAVNVHQRKIGAATEKFQLAVTSRLINNDIERIAGSIETALNEDAHFYGRYEAMQQSIPAALVEFQKAAKRLLDCTEKIDAGQECAFAENLQQTSTTTLHLWDVCAKNLDALLEIRMDSYKGARIQAIIATIIATILALLVVFMSARSILASLKHLVLYAEEVAQGNLNAKPEGNFSISLERLKNSIMAMVENLKTKMDEAHRRSEEALESKNAAETAMHEADRQKTIAEQQTKTMAELGAQIHALAERVASATDQLSSTSEEQARGVVSQKERAEQVAAAMEQMTHSVVNVASNASSTSQTAQTATESTRGGVDLVREAMGSITGVADSAEELEQVIAELNEQAGEIGRIINVINDIADQTNLLALNAAIEAARAGDAGRGFAVVADEVRKLAEKTMTATKEVEAAVVQIQNGAHNSANSMGKTKEQVEQSSQSSSLAVEALQKIMASIENISERVAQIATAAEEQSAAAEQINTSVDDIAQFIGKAKDGATQSADATRNLAQVSGELLQLSNKFMS
ncbi:MAG: methyl-accepting chemotaxis protein [Desulfovibrio sp.]|uniref:methyl-accepting chemotaxis protein n=1 Tax=Desulfovibrio sp. 7SRBS1 TaxID=3378064 RepID=UPI003B3F0F38